jgi:hypothetical protein
MGEECALSTRTIRFRNPTKLGLFSASWLRHELRSSECVAKTCRYLVSRIRWTVVLTGRPVVFSVYLARRLVTGTLVLVRMSMLVWIAVSTMVAIARSFVSERLSHRGDSKWLIWGVKISVWWGGMLAMLNCSGRRMGGMGEMGETGGCATEAATSPGAGQMEERKSSTSMADKTGVSLRAESVGESCGDYRITLTRINDEWIAALWP